MSVWSASPRSRGSESKAKFFEPGQRRQADNNRFGGNVSGMGNMFKGKHDKVGGGQKQLPYSRKWDAPQQDFSQTWSRSTQERIWKRRCLFIIRREIQNCQSRKWLHCHNFFQQRIWNAPDPDFTHAIVLLERSHEVSDTPQFQFPVMMTGEIGRASC